MLAALKRTFLLIVVNMLIVVSLSIAFQVVCALFGFHPGPNLGLWIFYAIIGMGGAFGNLLFSRQIAKFMMGVQVIDPNQAYGRDREVLDMVYSLAHKAGLPKMPEVGIYESPEINAFATGPSKSRALVAVSTGLLQRMDHDSVEGVLGHELTHVANGDMVTMTLIQGVVNTMVLIAARLIADLLAGQVESRTRPIVRMIAFYGLQIVLSLLGSVVVCYFSRIREFRADAGGARLAGRDRMIRGLRALQSVYEINEAAQGQNQSIATLKISGHRGFLALLATHPPLEERIHRLETLPL